MKESSVVLNRLNMEDYHDFSHKVFGDVFEALVAAVFLDSGGNLKTTKRVFMNILEPYLYVYGNSENVTEHPRTLVNEKWNKQSFANIKGHQIKISHLK